MERGRPAQAVALTDHDKAELENLVRQKTAAHRDVQRAQIALMANQGETSVYIAEALGLSEHTVCLWRGRAADSGKEGLKDHPRSGRPRRITDSEWLQWIALAGERADEEGGRSTPTLNEQVARAQERGVVSHIQLELEDGMETVARITSITARTYGAAFRTHTGRWEPVPDEGTLEDMVRTSRGASFSWQRSRFWGLRASGRALPDLPAGSMRLPRPRSPLG